MTHYEVLGVSPDALTADIRRAYLRLARDHHPDVHAVDGDAAQADAAERMQAINEAFAVVGEPDRRSAYDATLADERRTSWAPGTVSPDFVPFDDGIDPEDPAAEHDIPYGDGSPVHRSLQVGPVFLLVVALLSLGFGQLLGFRPLTALGVFALLATLVAFVAAPVYAIMRSHITTRD